MFYRSERLFLRPAWPEDWNAIHAAIDDEGIVRQLARAPWPYTESDARWFAGQPQDARLPHFLITRPDGGGSALIGSIGLSRIEGEVNIGYWIARAHWGQGYATEAGRAMLGLARGLGHKHLVGRHFLDNPASGLVLRRLGFRPSDERGAIFSAGRGQACPSVRLEIDLRRDHDNKDDSPDGGMEGRRAA